MMTTESTPGSQATESSETGNTDIAQLSYEEAREELITTVQALEAGNLTLEQSLQLWKRGEALADRCQAWLDGARDDLNRAQQARMTDPLSEG